MLYGQDKKAVFAYTYRPSVPTHGPRDGGFSVNLFETDMLTFDCLDPDRNLISEQVFAVPPTLRMRLLALVQSNASWLGSYPVCMRVNTDRRPVYTSYLGLEGFPLFMFEDLTTLMDCPFRSVRGHYARTMYNLLEDISSLFYPYGFNMTLEGFPWDPNIISPMQPVTRMDGLQIG